MPKNETWLKNKLCEWMKALAPDVFFFKVVGGAFQKRGIPDIICCVRGAFLAIELKSPSGGKVSELQKHEIERIRGAGGVAYVCNDLEAAKKLVMEILNAGK